MPLSPYEAAVETLDVAVAALGADAPAQRGVVLHDPALDCAQITVSISDLLVAETAAPGSRFGAAMTSSAGAGAPPSARQWSTGLVVWYVECVNTSAKPRPSAEGADAERLAERAWPLVRALGRHGYGGDSSCRARALGPAIPLPPNGGLAGWRIPITVDVD